MEKCALISRITLMVIAKSVMRYFRNK